MLEGRGGDEGAVIGAAGLLWNRRGQVLLVRHDPPSEWRERWVTPGGWAEAGEDPEDAFLREVWEETRLRPTILSLTCVYELTLTDGRKATTGPFFQFEALTEGMEASPGPGIREVRWFDELPLEMAFRGDYLVPYRRRKAGFLGDSDALEE